MTDKLAVEIIKDQAAYANIIDPGLRQAINAGEEELREVALAIQPLGLAELDLPDIAGHIMEAAADQGRLAGKTYILSLAGQLATTRMDDMPERTACGTLFKPYELSSYGDPAVLDDDSPWLYPSSGFYSDRDTRAAAIFATSPGLNKSQLNQEMPEGTVGEPQVMLTKFRKVGLIVVDDPSAEVPRSEGIVHTRKFDAFVAYIPKWQHAIRLRTLAHRLGIDENETQARIFKLAELLLY